MSIGLVKLFEHTSSMLSTLCSLAWNTSLADTPTACSRGTRDVCFHKPTPLFIVRHIVTNRIARIWSLVKYPKLFPLCMSVVFLNSVASHSHWHFCDHGSDEQVNKIALLNLDENFVTAFQADVHSSRGCESLPTVKMVRMFGLLLTATGPIKFGTNAMAKNPSACAALKYCGSTLTVCSFTFASCWTFHAETKNAIEILTF